MLHNIPSLIRTPLSSEESELRVPLEKPSPEEIPLSQREKLSQTLCPGDEGTVKKQISGISEQGKQIFSFSVSSNGRNRQSTDSLPEAPPETHLPNALPNRSENRSSTYKSSLEWQGTSIKKDQNPLNTPSSAPQLFRNDPFDGTSIPKTKPTPSMEKSTFLDSQDVPRSEKLQRQEEVLKKEFSKGTHPMGETSATSGFGRIPKRKPGEIGTNECCTIA